MQQRSFSFIKYVRAVTITKNRYKPVLGCTQNGALSKWFICFDTWDRCKWVPCDVEIYKNCIKLMKCICFLLPHNWWTNRICSFKNLIMLEKRNPVLLPNRKEKKPHTHKAYKDYLNDYGEKEENAWQTSISSLG